MAPVKTDADETLELDEVDTVAADQMVFLSVVPDAESDEMVDWMLFLLIIWDAVLPTAENFCLVLREAGWLKVLAKGIGCVSTDIALVLALREADPMVSPLFTSPSMSTTPSIVREPCTADGMSISNC
jgi:hypothetical protein